MPVYTFLKVSSRALLALRCARTRWALVAPTRRHTGKNRLLAKVSQLNPVGKLARSKLARLGLKRLRALEAPGQ